MVLYHKSNLVYTVVLSQFLIFQKNDSVQTSVLIFFTSRHYYSFEKLKLVGKQLCKLNCSYGQVSHTLNRVKIIASLLLRYLEDGRLPNSEAFLYSPHCPNP